jgi:hypothetical protein
MIDQTGSFNNANFVANPLKNLQFLPISQQNPRKLRNSKQLQNTTLLTILQPQKPAFDFAAVAVFRPATVCLIIRRQSQPLKPKEYEPAALKVIYSVGPHFLKSLESWLVLPFRNLSGFRFPQKYRRASVLAKAVP